MSSGKSDSNCNHFPVLGCSKPKDLACRACLGKFINKLTQNKLLTIRAAENVVRILPPLNVKKKEIDLALKIITKVCSEY